LTVAVDGNVGHREIARTIATEGILAIGHYQGIAHWSGTGLSRPLELKPAGKMEWAEKTSGEVTMDCGLRTAD